LLTSRVDGHVERQHDVPPWFTGGDRLASDRIYACCKDLDTVTQGPLQEQLKVHQLELKFVLLIQDV